MNRSLVSPRSAFSQHQEQASRDALLSRLTTRESQVLERIRLVRGISSTETSIHLETYRDS